MSTTTTATMIRRRLQLKLVAVALVALGIGLGVAPQAWAGKGGRRFTRREVTVANLTSRSHGAVGKNAITPRVVAKSLTKKETVLDFGAGRDALHARALEAKGFKVTAYEFGDNVVKGVHDPKALQHQYDVVYASNVLNVQSSPGMLDKTLAQIAGSVKPDGRFVGNYPSSPRKAGLKPAQVKTLLLKHFGEVRRVAGSSGTPVWEARRPRVGGHTAEIIVKTRKGTRIYRDREHGVGKRMGSDLYLHRQYAGQVVPSVLLAAARSQLPRGFHYDIVKYNAKTRTISFISSPDWDSAPEPSVGTAYTVHVDGRVKKVKATGKIYHHKWLFVRDSYKGFDVNASVARSRKWLALDKLDMSRIGSAEFWEKKVLPRLK